MSARVILAIESELFGYHYHRSVKKLKASRRHVESFRVNGLSPRIIDDLLHSRGVSEQMIDFLDER